MTFLIATKLNPPIIQSQRVRRPYLLNLLNDGLDAEHHLILVSAPAGFGKTVIVNEWVNSLKLPMTWLSLDAADDDPGRFFAYLVAALQKIDQSICLEIEAVLRAGQLPPAEILLSSLINDIQALKNPFLLVIDDFHVIQDEFTLQVFEQLVSKFPPALYLVLMTREDPSLPLARLRANNQLTEIRAGDLRFNHTEINHFFEEVMGLSLSQTNLAALEKRTEGWIVGLHLAGISLRGCKSPSDFIATLSGSHRFILSYLTEEVLNQQPADIQKFLLQTSILERLSGDLCNTVTGRSDSQSLLERLLSANLFLIPLDDDGRWYRYHQLFADLLRDRLNTLHKEKIPELHQRASQWFLHAGLDESGAFVSEAIQHALSAGDYDTAVHLIESHAMDMLMQWHIKTVDGWLSAIPSTWVEQSPQANLAFAWMYLMRADHSLAFPYLQRLGTMFADQNKRVQISQEYPELEAKWLALQAMLLNAQEKQPESLRLCNQALEIVSQDDIQVRSMIYLALANAYQQMDDYDRAVAAYQVLIQLGQQAGNSISELLGISGLGLLALEHGQYHFAYKVVTQGIARIERNSTLPPISTALYGELGVIHYQWHQLEQAHHYFQRSIQVSTLSGYSDAELFYGVILSRLFQIQGDLETASEKIEKAIDLMQVEAPAAVRDEVINQQVRILLAQNDSTSAEKILASRGFSFRERLSFPVIDSKLKAPFFSRDQIRRTEWILYNSVLRVLLYRSQMKSEIESLQQGIMLANYLIQTTLHNQYIPFALETLLIRAQLHAVHGDDQACRSDYIQALALGEAEGLISIFVEEGEPVAKALTNLLDQVQAGPDQVDIVKRKAYIQSILAAFPKIKSSATIRAGQPGPIEPLTERELDVLRLMAQGQKYEDMAANLYISLNTVRSHVKAIYGKLGVNNRTRAIEIGRKENII